MPRYATSDNPYTSILPTDNGRLFVGRQAELSWLQQTLAETSSPRPIILTGPPHIGKSTLLHHLSAGHLGEPYIPVYIDLGQVSLHSLSPFLQDIAQATIIQLNRHNVAAPSLDQTAFVADPYRAFKQQFLRPAADACQGKKLLFLFDNLNALLQQLQNGLLGQHTVNSLHNLLYNNGQNACIFALTLPDETINPEHLVFLEDVRHCEIGPLSNEATMSLVRQPVNYTIVKDVAEYIYCLTNGRPYETRLLCQGLYARHEEQNLKHVTVADVALVHKHVFGSIDSSAGWPPAYQLAANTSLMPGIQRLGRRIRRRRGALTLFAAALLALLAILIVPSWSRQIINQQIALANLQANSTGASNAILSEPTTTPETAVVHAAVATRTATPTEIASRTPAPSPAATEIMDLVLDTATPFPTATPSRFPPTLTRPQDGMPMILIPAGTFIMGSADDDFMAGADEKPQREVTMDYFYIDKYQVNVEQYAAFLNRLGGYDKACDRVDCTLPRHIAGYTSHIVEQDLGDGTIQYAPLTGFARYPVNHVSWYGADSYCRSVGARLPTEAEWEYAARGNDGRLYPWGNSPPNPTRAVYESESFENLKPVDALPEGASPFGVYGMAGSVWEWTADWYNENYYAEAPDYNPTGPETGFARTIRGGSWPNNNRADRIRAANRSALTPDFLSSTVGFRCARDP